MASTSTKIKQGRRAIRAVKRAGERKSFLEEDSVDSEVVEPMEVDEAEDLETPPEHVEVNEVEPAVEEPAVEVSKTDEEAVAEEIADDGDDNHRHIADLKGDLEGYKSEEDPDYDPTRDEDVEAEDELADSRE